MSMCKNNQKKTLRPISFLSGFQNHINFPSGYSCIHSFVECFFQTFHKLSSTEVGFLFLVGGGIALFMC